jgi:hypothetical protein
MTGSIAQRLNPASDARINNLMHVFFFQAVNNVKHNIFKNMPCIKPPYVRIIQDFSPRLSGRGLRNTEPHGVINIKRLHRHLRQTDIGNLSRKSNYLRQKKILL